MAGFLGLLKYVKGPVTLGDDLTVSGDATVAGNLSVTGALTTNDGVASGADRVVGGRHSLITAAGSSLTNSTDETVLASATIEANTLKAGTQLLCRFKARVTADNGATTLTARLRIGTAVLGGTALVASAATDTSSGDLFIGQFLLTARAAPGAAAECVGSGMFCQPAAAGGAMVAANLNATNFATNGALIIGITGEWNAADANAVQAEEFSVEIIG